jgi:DNA-binding transcriptional LysR family regulator
VAFPTLVSERLGEVPLVAVASPSHPLAQLTHRIPRHEMAKHLQLVLTDRSDLMSGRDFGVVAPSTWRLADLSTKYAFLKDGIGWGGMPLHMVEKDISSGSLVVLNADDVPPGGYMLTMSAYHRTSDPPGPAGRWLIDHLKDFWEHPRMT